MLPVIALVGRPNVGKSTLFNDLTRSRDALVADVPGLTRDRQYGYGRVGPSPYIVVDTGGLSGDEDGLDGLMARQTQAALEEADRVLFLVDGREGLTAADEHVAALLHRGGQPVTQLVHQLGDEIAVGRRHGDGLAAAEGLELGGNQVTVGALGLVVRRVAAVAVLQVAIVALLEADSPVAADWFREEGHVQEDDGLVRYGIDLDRVPAALNRDAVEG